jgi:hypothetical protein
MVTKKEMEKLIQKIEWEGGLEEYLVYYGGDVPEELQEEARAAKEAIVALNTKIAKLALSLGMEPMV